MLIYNQGCKTNSSGYSIRKNTNRSTFVLKDNVVSGMVLDVLRRMERICQYYHTKRLCMKHFRITNTFGS
jgi:hypothetical protein